MKRERLIWLGLLGITLMAYSPVLRNHFINYDDELYITNNKEVFQGLSWHSFIWAFTSTGKTGNWHPLTWLSLMLDCQLFGEHAWAHHLENVLWHAANALLLFGILRRWTATTWRSAIVAALFAVHPLHVESVAWASERKDMLSTFFGLLSIDTYCRNTDRATHQRHWQSLIYFLLSLLCKPMLVTLPLLLIILDFWPLQRWTPWDLTNEAKNLSPNSTVFLPFSRILIEKIPFVILSTVFSVITIVTQHNVGAMVTETTLPILDRPVYAVVGYVVYLWKMIWPFDLVVVYPYPLAFPVWQASLSAGMMIGFTCLAAVRARKAPYCVAGWLWYVVSLVPVIGLLQVGSQWYADRYTYLPLVGIFVALVWSIGDTLKGLRLSALVPGLLATAVILFFTMVTALQTRYWKDSLTLFEHAIALKPSSAVSQHNYAQALAAKGKQREAAEHFQHALKLFPGFPKANYGLGVCLSMMGSNDMATQCFRDALSVEPGFAQAHYGLATVLAQQGKLDTARAHFEEALRIEPDYAAAHTKYGSLLVIQGYPDIAESHYRAAIKFMPQYEEPQYCLAGLLARQKNFPEAVVHYHAAIKLMTNDVSALNDLAWILATENDPKIHDPAQAVQLARRACELTKNQVPGYLDTLAAAYSESGNFSAASDAIEKAVAAARAGGQEPLAKKIGERLNFYRKNISYRAMASGPTAAPPQP